MLCAECDQITLFHKPGSSNQDLVRSYSKLQDLIKNAKSGCHFCILVQTAITDIDTAHSDAERTERERIVAAIAQDVDPEIGIACQLTQTKIATMNLVAQIVDKSSKVLRYCSLGGLYTMEDDPVAERILDRPINRVADSDDVFSLANSWLNVCLSSHDDCPRGNDDILPTRLLDVTSPDPKIHIPFPGEKGKYIALSYCWGRGRTDYVLTKSTLAAKQENIPLDSLPKTIQDAVTITRRLGFSFLWVDALCILQDSLEDWEAEAAAMADVYSRGVVTIAAASASAATEGIFKPRIFEATIPPRLKLICDDGTAGTAYLRYQHPSKSDTYQPLDSRAWAFQERLLSRRMIIYGSHHLTWECHTKSLAEGEAFYRGPYLMRLSNDRHPSSPDLDLSDRTKYYLYCQWSYIIRDYSARYLTVGSDKLPALAGIAERFSHYLGRDQYVAGIWRSHLPRSLLWIVDRHKILKSPRVKEWRAPSWSWASVDVGHYGIPNFAGRTIADVRSVEVEASTVSRYGAVKSAVLHLQAPIVKVRAVGKNEAVDLDSYLVPLHSLFLTGSDDWMKNSEAGSCYFDDHDEFMEMQDGGLDLFCLRIITDRGLLICETGKEGFWRRLGLFRLWNLEDYQPNGSPPRSWDCGVWFEGCEAKDVLLV